MEKEEKKVKEKEQEKMHHLLIPILQCMSTLPPICTQLLINLQEKQK